MDLKVAYGPILALIFCLAPIGVVVGFVWIGRRVHYRRDRKSPISKDFLRGPGHTVGEKLQEVHDDLLLCFVAATPLPLFLLAGWSLQERKAADEISSFPFVYILVLLVGASWLGYRLSGLIKQARDLRLGLDAEIAAGQELNQLLRDGYEVFHDIDGNGKFNVDHVVVGRAGVFAIETKGRSKPIRQGKAEYKVLLDGDRLVFPGWVETEPLIQAKRNADWLAKWLSSATGEPISVKPVLILPGWWVDRKAPSEVAVLSAGSCRQAIPRLGIATLSDQQVRRIAHQLESKCRDVAPRKNN